MKTTSQSSAKLIEIQTLAKSCDQKLRQEFGGNVLGMGGTLFLGKYYAKSDKIFFGLNPGTWKPNIENNLSGAFRMQIAFGGIPIPSSDIGKIAHTSLPNHLPSVLGLKMLPALS